VEEGNQQNLLQTQSQMEQFMKTMEYVVTQFASTPELKTALGLTIKEEDDFRLISDLKKRMYKLQFHISIQDALLVNQEHRWVISNLGFQRYEDVPNQEQKLYQMYLNAESILFWETSAATGSSPGKISLINKLPFLEAYNNPKGMIVIDINTSDIDKLILQNEKLGHVFVLDKEKRFILGESGFTDDDKLFQESLVSGLQGHEEAFGHFTVNIRNERYWIEFRNSSANAWTYVAIQKVSDITKDAKAIGWVTLLFCLIILVFSSIWAILGTKRIHQPIGRLYVYAKSISGKLENNQTDEVGYIEEKIRYILNSKEKLNDQVKMDIIQLKEFFVTRLLLGQLREKDIREKLHALNLPNTWAHLYVMVLQIDSLEHTRFSKEDQDLLLFAINNIIKEIIPEDSVIAAPLFNESQVTLLTDQSLTIEEGSRRIRELAESVRVAVHRYLELTVSIGISRPFKQLKQVRVAYEEGITSLNRRLHLGGDMILQMDDGVHDRRIITYPVEFEQDLMQAIRLVSYQTITSKLEDFIYAIQEQNPTINEFRRMMMKLMTRLMDMVTEEHLSFFDVFGDQPLTEQFQTLQTVGEYQVWFSQSLLTPIVKNLEKSRNSHFITVSKKIIEIIHNEFKNNLTLEECAARLNYHPVYLSRILKKEIGLSFSEYLGSYRMTMAKKWLCSTEMNIADIANELNYANSSTFIRYFSKSEGMTPGQYRKAYGSRHSDS
jgi:two-component system response regulator YesN